MKISRDHSVTVELEAHEKFRLRDSGGRVVLIHQLTAGVRDSEPIRTVRATGFFFKKNGELSVIKSTVRIPLTVLPEAIRHEVQGRFDWRSES